MEISEKFCAELAVPRATAQAEAAAHLATLIRNEFVGVPWDDMDYVLDEADWRLILDGLDRLAATTPAGPSAGGGS
jgi:hypothetical protein